MEQPIPIFETKMIPPSMNKLVIRRQRIVKKMLTIPQYPLTIIHSGAGYGKSTALSLFINDWPKNHCWYTITANDDDLIPFITYFVHSIRKRYHKFGQELLPFIKNMNSFIQEHELNMLGAIFIKEITKISEETFLILDDFHLIDHSFPINQWLEKIVEHLPQQIHLIVASRSKPKWDLITRWKVSGKLLEIDKNELALTREEVEILYEDFYDLYLNDYELHSIYEMTEGWVIAVSLIAQQLKNDVSTEAIIHYQHASMDELFHYLALEVLSNQSPIMQSFIESVSVLEELTPEICNEVLSIHGAENILGQLVETNAFLIKLSSDQYRFHALFKAAIERKLKEENVTLYKKNNEKAAQYYEKHDSLEMAIYHYEKVQNYERIAALLEKSAPVLLNSGKLEKLASYFRLLSNITKNKYLSLWYYEGEVHRYLAYYEKAKACYSHLIKLATLQVNDYLVGIGFEGLAKIYIDTIQPCVAEQYLYEAIDRLEKHHGKNNEETQILYMLMAENFINSGQAKNAEFWFNKLGKLKHLMELNNLDARMYLRTGRLVEAKNILEKRLQENKQTLPQTHRETEILLSFIDICLGNTQEAKHFAQKGIEQGLKHKNLFVEACGWMRLAHAGQVLNEYELYTTEECYFTALDIMEKIHVPRGKSEPYMGLCLLYGKKGEYEKALEYGKLGLYQTEKVQDRWLSSFIRLSIGIAAFHCQQYETAKEKFIEAETSFKHSGDSYGLMLSRLWLSIYYYSVEEWEFFKETMTEFLQDVQVGNYEYIFSKSCVFSPKDLQSLIPLLMKAREWNLYHPFAQSILQSFGFDELHSHPGYTLQVETLGGFRIFLGHQYVSDPDWQRAKAKELFRFLVINKNNWWSKEEIYERLWPETREKNMEQEFKVILNSCNKALEPKRKARSSPFYILRQNNMYRINPQAMIEIDFEQFSHYIQEGLREKHPEKAITVLLKGLDLYKGDFLSGTGDLLSIENERNYYRTLFLRGAERLAQVYVQLQQFEEAIFWCEKILNVDSSWEEAYRLLMFCHYQKNNRPLAIKYYKHCCTVLMDEFGCEPMGATTQMYEMIINSKNAPSLN